MKRKYLSQEHKEKIRNTLLGHIVSKETKLKIKEKRKNQIFTEETKQKMKEARLKRKDELGYLNSPETRIKLSKISKELYKIKPSFGMTGKKQSKNWKEWRKNFVLPKNDTSIEIKIQNFLKQLKIKFLTHQYVNEQYGYQCDILIPSMNMIIECYGDYWHKIPYGTSLDTLRCQELRSNGVKVKVFWEKEIKVMELNDFIGEIYGTR